MLPDFAAAFFRGRQRRAFKRAAGFDRTRGHTEPTDLNPRIDAWAGRLLHAEMAAELDAVYANAKKTFALKRRDISLEVDDENGGTVETTAFRFDIHAGQDGGDPAKTVIERRISLNLAGDKLPPDFDAVFPEGIDEIVVPVEGLAEQYEDVVDALEDKAAALAVTVGENPASGIIELAFGDGALMTIHTKIAEMVIRVPGRRDCLSLIQAVQDSMVSQFVDPGPLLPGVDKKEP